VAKRKDGGWFCVNLEDTPAVFTLEGTRHSLEAGASGVFHTEEPTGSVVLQRPAVHQFSDQWNAHPAGDNCLILDDWSLRGSPVELAPLYELKPEGIGVMGETVFGPVPLQRQLTTTHTLVYEATFSLRQVMPLALVIEKGNLAGTWQIECNGQPLNNWRDTERYDLYNREHALYEELRPGENRLRVSLIAENATDGMLGPCRLFGQFLVEEDASLSCLPPSWKLAGTKGWERQGFPHYSGIIRYSQAFRLEHVGRDLWLELSNPPSNFLSVSINGHRLSSLFWAPWRLRIDDRLLQENNVLALEVSNTLHNMIYPDPRPSGLLATVALKEPSDSR